MSKIYVISFDDRYYDEGGETPFSYKLTEEEAISFCEESNKKFREWSQIQGLYFYIGKETDFNELMVFVKENNIENVTIKNGSNYIVFLPNFSVSDERYMKFKYKKKFYPYIRTYLEAMGYSSNVSLKYDEVELEERTSI